MAVRGLRLSRLAAAAVLLGLGGTASASAAVTEMGSVGTLSPGGSQFWNGPMVARSGSATGGQAPRPNPPGAGAPQCEQEAYACFAYELAVGAGGSRLRVAIDHPHLEDVFGLELRAPDGSVAAVATGSTVDGTPTHSSEVFVDAPAAGVWRATAVGHDVSDSAFRMRARLEPTSPASAGPARDLLPNLQANPPSRIGFAGCQPSEVSQHGARVCLRFAQGPQNVGDGPLLLTVRDVGEPREDPVPFVTDPFPVHLVSLAGTQYQVVQRSDGSSYEVPAGEFEYHVQHHHYHHSAVGQFELLRVADERTGVLQAAGAGPKQGFCMDDYFIAHWAAFDNAPARDLASYVDPRLDCAAPVAGRTQMKLSAGWGDIYPDALEGQYVEFGDNGDGLYVIRVTTMPGRDILECDYADNVAYAYLRVMDREVTVLERGLGTSPWDAGRVVVHDGRQPAADSEKAVPDLRLAGVPPAPCARPARGAPPNARPAPAARRGGRFSFRVRARGARRLEIRDARRRLVARARLRPRRRARVSGIAVAGRYTWRAGRARGRFTVRDQGIELPAPSRIRVRVRSG